MSRRTCATASGGWYRQIEAEGCEPEGEDQRVEAAADGSGPLRVVERWIAQRLAQEGDEPRADLAADRVVALRGEG